MVPAAVRLFARNNRLLYRAVVGVRAYRFERRAAREQARCRAIAATRGWEYSEDVVRRLVEERLRRRGLWRGRRQSLHFFVAVHVRSWEGVLLETLRRFGDVTHFDWSSERFDDSSRDWLTTGRGAMNRRLLVAFHDAHGARPVDLFFGYLSNRTVGEECIEQIARHGVITVNLSLDDWHAFWGSRINGMWQGNAPLVRAFDVNWTSTLATCVYYVAEDGVPLFLPEGADPEVHRPHQIARDIGVSFVGQRYAHRPLVIDRLRRRGIAVETFGPGWPSGPLPLEEMVGVYSRSAISVGFGGTNYSRRLVCLKGRDFEVPMSGGLYLTQYNPELELCYKIGSEILCYHHEDDLVKQIRDGLRDLGRLEEVRAAGRARALAEHTWEHRTGKRLSVVGLT